MLACSKSQEMVILVGLNKFNNVNVEISQVKFGQKRSKFIRIGHCDLHLAITWSKLGKNEIAGVPRILGGCHKALKFIVRVMNNHARINELLDALLANEEDAMLSERSSDEAESSDNSDDFSVDDLTSASRSTETSGNASEANPSAVEMRNPMIEGGASPTN